MIAHLERKPDHADQWLRKLIARRNKNVAAVALAAKIARIAWALLAHERSYQHDYVATRKAAWSRSIEIERANRLGKEDFRRLLRQS